MIMQVKVIWFLFEKKKHKTEMSSLIVNKKSNNSMYSSLIMCYCLDLQTM